MNKIRVFGRCHLKSDSLGTILDCATKYAYRQLCLPCSEYLAGKTKPHYPVPAIYRPIDLTTYWLLPKGTDVQTLMNAWELWANARYDWCIHE